MTPFDVEPSGLWAYCLCCVGYALMSAKIHELRAARGSTR